MKSSNAPKQKRIFVWQNILLYVIILSPLIYTILSYHYMAFHDDYFIRLLSSTISFIENHWKLFIWILLIILVAQLNPFLSFINNVGALFTKTQQEQNISDGNDGLLSDEDFGKEKFAHDILEIISNFHSDNKRTQNLVIGLDGKWGDGKTFVIKQIKKILKEEQFSEFHLFSFQPWLFAKDTNYTNSFIDRLNIELVKLNCGINLFYLSAFKDMLNNTCGFWGRIISFFTNKSDEELKEIIQQRINQTHKKFLVVIDDLDRLDDVEILQIFKLIRCVANFENMYFLLCLDRELVEKKIKNCFMPSEFDNDAFHYCDKIINIYFEIPVISHAQLSRFLYKLIKQDPQLHSWKEKSLNEIDTETAKKVISKFNLHNIRDVKILLNKLKALSLIHYSSLKSDENTQILANITNFYVFWALETIKKNDISLYLTVKNILMSSTVDQIFKNPHDDKDIQELILYISIDSYKYFAYGDGNIILSDTEYRTLKNNLQNNLNSISQMEEAKELNSFFEKAAQDKTIDGILFNKIVHAAMDGYYENLHFDKFFESHITLFEEEQFLKAKIKNKERIFTLMNKTTNFPKLINFINTYVKFYNEDPKILPKNNLIYYLDFNKYTPELFGILFKELISKEIEMAPGLLDLLNQFIVQIDGDTSLWNINILKKQCNLPVYKIITKLKDDRDKATKTLQNYKLEKKSKNELDDNYYQNVVMAYDKIIEFIEQNYDKS